MKLIIGRDAATSKLKITTDTGKSQTFGLSGSVPMSVSREHCQLTLNDNSTMTLTNLKLQNTTMVNGLAVQERSVTTDDKIQLGADAYTLNWDDVQSMLPKVADIRPLRQIWESYEKFQQDSQIADRKFNALSRITGIITMLAILLTFFITRDNPFFIALYVIAIGISVAFTYKAWKDSARVPKEREERKKEFQRKYVCPRCGHFLGFTDYEIISQNSQCPYCKAQYRK